MTKQANKLSRSGLVFASFITALSMLLFPYFAYSQQAKKPAYNEGDWWRITSELEVKDSSRRGGCQDAYKEWLVKLDKANLAHLYGINGVKQEEASCDLVLGWVFGISDTTILQFPLSVGQTWTHRYETGSPRRPTLVEPEYKVVAWEKVQTPKGTFEAFKITRAAKWVTGRGDQRYANSTEYYAPKLKAIVSYESDNTSSKRKVTLVDFNLANVQVTN